MQTISIGRGSNNDIIINRQDVSTSHAIITFHDNENITLKDLNSTNGTFVNGKRITEVRISIDDLIQVSNADVNWQDFLNIKPSQPVQTYLSGNIISIGRNPSNQLVVSQADVSSFHAAISTTSSGTFILKDNNSTNGTFVNGKRIVTHQLLPGDRILLSNKYVVEWEQLLGKNQQDPLKEKYQSVSSSKSSLWGWIIAVAAIIAIVLFFKPTYSYLNSHIFSSSVNINEKYKNSVVLIYHSFVYHVSDGKTDIYLTKDGDGFKQYEEGKTGPIQITGTGFFVSSSGEIITNRHIALPWEYSEDKENLQQSIKEYFKQLASLGTTDIQFELVDSYQNLKITGKSIYIGIATNNSFVNSVNDFIPCLLCRESGDRKIDLALLQTKSKTLPAMVTNIVDLDEAVTNDKEIKTGEELHMIGYPAGFVLATTEKGIMANFQNGQISRLSDGVDFGHNVPTIGGGSGSPIFNKYGKLVGINYKGFTQAQGFNMAILAKHAVKLYNNQ